MSRPRPDENAVREQLRAERETAEGAGPEGSASNGAPEAAPEAGARDDADAEPRAEARPEAEDEPRDQARAADDSDREEPAAESQADDEVDPVAEARRERDEYLDLAKRTQADFENYRKRAAKDISAAGSRARIGLIRELLPVVDNLERALASSSEEADTGLVEGVKLVYGELQGVLQRAGIEAIEPDGDQFDPTLHEALSTRPQDGAEAGVVLDVVEKGYRTNDTVIRPARVIVAA